ncbi:tetratricopeptide repeat-containing sulfotransferase family protein [Asticcacaulis taihuensis]|uniref:tetratricopeptide repeat-containing sulfotransferase family protein n=1 Tax=Asticcacaulis taihuensis TaxID=260084 RepID=UPI0026EE2087|nr:tetratricopeptide repeat-containing sulfotransferase family protein [Asticcacaulis taihuensis]
MTIADIDADLKDRDALLQQARDLRSRQRIPEALAVLVRLEAAYPCFSRLFQERAHCHIGLGDAHEAMAALHAAVRLNPTLPASWDMLEQLSRRTGDTAQASMAAQHLATLKQLPREVVMANSLLADGDLDPAEQIIRDYLRQMGGNVGALYLLARIRQESGATEEAETLLEAVLANAPDYHEARLDYAMVLLQQQKHLPARQQAGHLLAYDPDNRDYLKQYAAACIGLGDYEPLIAIYDRLLAGDALSAAEIADLRLWRAAALKITGNQAEAIADYRAALEALPDQGVAWFGLANLKTWRFSDDDIVRMRVAESTSSLQDMDRVYLCFALGKALEDRAEFADSWAYYAKGNATRRQTAIYRPEVAEASATRLKSVFTAEFFAERSGWGLADPAPIFVLGLPRSGSTLIEQILASHSQVEGTQELTLIGRYASELCGQDPECGLPLDIEAMRRLSPGAARALGEGFLAETRTFRRLGRPFFIDKMPNNFWHIGLIHLILPRAAIIDIRREPMASGFSNFKQLYGTINNEFSYDLDHLGRHYRTYIDVMQHWDTVLPGKVLRVPYENVVDDLEAHVRHLLAHCRLPFEATCLSFHETKRSVRTPSSEQVRQPIYRHGVEQWKHFEPWLGPLRNALGDALNTYRL